MLENSDARAVVVEDDEQLEKIRAVRDKLPKLEFVIRMTGESDDTISTDELVARGTAHTEAEWEERWRSVGPGDMCTFIYTSGTTGPPKGCVISHGNYRSMLDMIHSVSVLTEDELTYLYLPLAHSFALLVQLGTFDLGAALAFWERDPLKIMPNIAEVKPTYFPSVPRIFEKIYTAATTKAEQAGGIQKTDLLVGDRASARRSARTSAGALVRAAAEAPARNRRPARAVEHPQAVRGPAEARRLRRRADQPRHPALLRRRRRAGARGLGDDGDVDRGDDLDPGGLQVRHGRQAVPRRRGEDRRRRRDPRQGAEHLPGLLQERGGDRARRSSTAGCTPATSARSTPTAI